MTFLILKVEGKIADCSTSVYIFLVEGNAKVKSSRIEKLKRKNEKERFYLLKLSRKGKKKKCDNIVSRKYAENSL